MFVHLTKSTRRRATLLGRLLLQGRWAAVGIIVLAAPIAQAQLSPSTLQREDAALQADALREKFPGSAPLKTNLELERLLKRADQFAADRQFDLATVLWQKVLDVTTGTLMTRDGRIYTSLSGEVERTLAALPPEGLSVYRLTADGDAQALLSTGSGASRGRLEEEEALAGVVRRYFISSLGDEAAYQLACLALDRRDFVGASRLLTKILQQYPDPTVPRSHILLRLAVASSRLGDAPAASAALEELANTSGPHPSQTLLEAVRADVEKSSTLAISLARSSQDWPMSLGGPGRKGHMKGLPASAMSSTLTELWGYRFEVHASAAGSASLAQRWRQIGRSPVRQLLMSDGRLFFKTQNDLVCWNVQQIESAPTERVAPAWRTAWTNAYQVDGRSQVYINMGPQATFPSRPITPREVLLLGDRVHASMSISQGVIYNIEGRRYPRHAGDQLHFLNPRQSLDRGDVMRRSRKNYLAAYDTRTGRALWYRSPAENDSSGDAELGFLAAPVPMGNLLLTPVTEGGTLWLYALSRHDGTTVWKSYLCDEPAGGCSPWSSVAVAVEGRDAYVICGAGVVFAMDAVSGAIRFATRYQRHGTPDASLRDLGYDDMLVLHGWEEDVVIPYGGALLVMATDHDRLLAVDCRSGELLWEMPRTPFDHPASYCLGVADRSLFVAGSNVVRRYEIVASDGKWSGRLLWELELDQSFGRGALTDNAIYMSVDDVIVRIDLATGKIQQQVKVKFTSDEPLGNLFSDGQRLWIVGADRIYALGEGTLPGPAATRDSKAAPMTERDDD